MYTFFPKWQILASLKKMCVLNMYNFHPPRTFTKSHVYSHNHIDRFPFNFFLIVFSLSSDSLSSLIWFSLSLYFLSPLSSWIQKKIYTNHQILQIYSKSRSQIHQTLSLKKKKKIPSNPKCRSEEEENAEDEEKDVEEEVAAVEKSA